jgi:NDP-sugar pyrophosphorylase family protein
MKTIANSVKEIRGYDDFFMISCDAFGIIDSQALEGFISRVDPDALIFTFRPTLLQQKMSGQHTHVTVKEDRITAVHIKSRSGEDDKGLAGFFYFKSGKLFDSLRDVPKDPKNELIADHILKYLVDLGKKVYAYPLESYIHLGTVPEYEEYIFWSKYSKVLLDKGYFSAS